MHPVTNPFCYPVQTVCYNHIPLSRRVAHPSGLVLSEDRFGDRGLCSTPTSSSNGPVLFILPKANLFGTLPHRLWSVSTLALKSPSRTSLFLSGIKWMACGTTIRVELLLRFFGVCQDCGVCVDSGYKTVVVTWDRKLRGLWWCQSQDQEDVS